LSFATDVYELIDQWECLIKSWCYHFYALIENTVIEKINKMTHFLQDSTYTDNIDFDYLKNIFVLTEQNKSNPNMNIIKKKKKRLTSDLSPYWPTMIKFVT